MRERVHHFSDYLCDLILCEGTQFPNFYYVPLPTLLTVFFGPTQSLLQHDDLGGSEGGGGLELDDLSKGDGQKHT
jgi:hypothetical protein